MDEHRDERPSRGDPPLSGAVVQLIASASAEAARLDHEYVGTEHLTLALTELTGPAAPLPAVGLDPVRVNTLITGIVTRGRAAPKRDVERPLTSRTKSALAMAAEAARELGHPQVGVAHVIVGLLRERMNIGAQVLAGEGLSTERAYDYARGQSSLGGPP